MLTRLFHLLLCVLLIGPLSVPGSAVMHPEIHVWGSPDFSADFASETASQVLEPHQINRRCGYDFAPEVHKYLYAHDDPVNGIDPSGHSSIELSLVGAIQSGLRSSRQLSTSITKRKIVRQLREEVVGELLSEGVYFLLFEMPGGVLEAYIGQSKNIERRVADHATHARKLSKELGEKVSLHVVGYVQVDPGKMRVTTRKFIREIIEKSFLNLVEANPDVTLANKNSPVSEKAYLKRVEKHFKNNPQAKVAFKKLFKKLFR